MNKIPYHKIEKFADEPLFFIKGVSVIKRKHCHVVDHVSVGGDAPKALVRVYEYESGRRRRTRKNSWPLYIAKTGHKWYPIESVTELLLNRLGVDFGLVMADSRICMLGGQLRFLSRYFLDKRHSELVHGADIFAGYLGDRELIEEVEECNMAQDLFTLQFIADAVGYFFPLQRTDLMCELAKMLLFDALVGNNDRHFYNWGVVRSLDGSFQPYFAPIYDTARGLFWNQSESKLLLRTSTPKGRVEFIRKYCDQSRPKVGWVDETKLNHFKLVDKIYRNEFYITREEIKLLFLPSVLERMFHTIDCEFSRLLSKDRLSLIRSCLEYRYHEIVNLLV